MFARVWLGVLEVGLGRAVDVSFLHLCGLFSGMHVEQFGGV